MFRMIKLSLAALVLLLAGSYLLALVTAVVASLRLGNPLPLSVLAVLALSLLRTGTTRLKGRTARTVEYAGYLCLGLTYVSVFIASLAGGLAVAVAASTVVLLLGAATRDPQRFRDLFQSLLDMSASAPVSSGTAGVGVLGAPWQHAGPLLRDVLVLVLPEGMLEGVVPLLRGREGLPVCLVHTEGADLVVVRQADPRARQVPRLLASAGVSPVARAPPLLALAAVALPLLQERVGLPIDEYVLVTDPESVDRLLLEQPRGMVVCPHGDGLACVVHLADCAVLSGAPLQREGVLDVCLLQAPVSVERGTVSSGGETGGTRTA